MEGEGHMVRTESKQEEHEWRAMRLIKYMVLVNGMGSLNEWWPGICLCLLDNPLSSLLFNALQSKGAASLSFQ